MMIRRSLFSALALLFCVACKSSTPVDEHLVTSKKKEWKLQWEDNFDGNTWNDKVWSKVPDGESDWKKNMSDYPGCYEVKDGHLILWGVVNDGKVPGDPRKYLTGGLFTKGKMSFGEGRIEIRAKLQGAQGAWPALWMLPEDEVQWPNGGEIDIIERLNHDNFVYQTIHTHYTDNLKIKNNPMAHATATIHPNEYNTYAVEHHKDEIVFFVNGKKTFTYPRIHTDKKGQFPFDRKFYLLMDMQLGGSWVGKVNPAQLPVKMEIDWVKYYAPDVH